MEMEPKKTYEQLISTLAREEGWVTKHIFHYQGFWYPDFIFPVVISLGTIFNPRPNQILLTSYPKSGTTWLKALTFAITNQNDHAIDDAAHPLLTKSPHECVPTLDFYGNKENPNFENFPILSTHIPYSALLPKLAESGCKVVYVARNPNDVFFSLWHFAFKLRRDRGLPFLPLQVAFDLFCKGVSPWGSYWDHVLGFWKASLEFPDTILFLNYEEIKDDPLRQLKRLAAFLGRPFSVDQEKQEVVEKIISLCSFEKLSETNKSGDYNNGVVNVKKDVYFRKGKVGDWKNELTENMAERLKEITAEKFKGFGFTTYFHMPSK